MSNCGDGMVSDSPEMPASSGRTVFKLSREVSVIVCPRGSTSSWVSRREMLSRVFLPYAAVIERSPSDVVTMDLSRSVFGVDAWSARASLSASRNSLTDANLSAGFFSRALSRNSLMLSGTSTLGFLMLTGSGFSLRCLSRSFIGVGA